MRSPIFEHKSYYGTHCVGPHQVNGELAHHTWAGDQLARQCEVLAGVNRPEIGRIEELDLQKENSKWTTIYDENDPVLNASLKELLCLPTNFSLPNSSVTS